MARFAWLHAFREVLFSPSTFFEERTPRQGVAGHVVFVVAGLHFLGLLALGIGIAGLLGFKVEGARALDILGAGFGGMVVGESLIIGAMLVVEWLVTSAVVHVIVKLRHGQGTIGDTLFVVGWSLPATLVQLLVAGGSALLAVHGLDPGPTLEAQVEAATGTIGARGFLAGLVGLLWQAYIYVPGLARTHDIRRETAIGVAAVAVLLGVVGLLLP